MSRPPRRAFTLVEVVIAVALIGLFASLATLTLRRVPPPPYDPARVVEESSRVAIAEARTISFRVRVNGEVARATVFADGSVLADSAIHLARPDTPP
jgi:prepilin-type N-terminal cleavage/methylation domain-containing protein